MDHVESISLEFKTDIRAIAQVLARQEKAELVLERHTDEAFAALGRIGFNRRPVYARPELEVGLGVSFVTLAGNCPSYITGLFPHWNGREPWTTGIMVAMILSGILLTVHGWWRGTPR